MKTSKIIIKLLIALSFSFNLYAGKEAGDGEVLVLKEDGTYEVASRHFISRDYEDYRLSKDMINFINQLFEQASHKFNTSRSWHDNEFKGFKKAIYGDLREFRLVEKINEDCRSYEKHELPTKYTLLDAACTKGQVTYLDKNLLKKIDALNLALILIHEGIHSYNPSYSHESIADIIRAIHVVETKFKLRRPLTKNEYLTKEERRAVTKFNMRLLQLLNLDGKISKLDVTKSGVLLHEGATFEIGSKGQTKIAAGVEFFTGKFLITNSTLVNSRMEFLRKKYPELEEKYTRITDSTFTDSNVRSYTVGIEVSNSVVDNSNLDGVEELNGSNISKCSNSGNFTAANATCENSKFVDVSIEDSTISNSDYSGKLRITNGSEVNNIQFGERTLIDFVYSAGATIDNSKIENSKIILSTVQGQLKNSTIVDSDVFSKHSGTVLANLSLNNSVLSLRNPSGRSETLPEEGGSDMSHIKITMENSSYIGGYFFSYRSEPMITLINTYINVDGIAFKDLVEIRNTSINLNNSNYNLLKGLEFLLHDNYKINSKGKEYCYFHNGTIFDSDNRSIRKSNRFPKQSCD